MTMSEQDQKKAEELKKLLERMPASGSFESASLSGKIVTLAKELFGRDAATLTTPADQHDVQLHK